MIPAAGEGALRGPGQADRPGLGRLPVGRGGGQRGGGRGGEAEERRRAGV